MQLENWDNDSEIEIVTQKLKLQPINGDCDLEIGTATWKFEWRLGNWEMYLQKIGIVTLK